MTQDEYKIELERLYYLAIKQRDLSLAYELLCKMRKESE